MILSSFRTNRGNSCGREAASVDVDLYCRFQHWSVRICASEQTFIQNVPAVHLIVKMFPCPVERFLFRILVVFNSSDYVILFFFK